MLRGRGAVAVHMATLAVTGATGRVGGRVARTLAAAGLEQRLIVRDPARAPRLPHAEVAVSQYGDATASQAALQGVDVLFMASAAESADRVDQHRTFVEAAARAGVQHVVYLSFFNASPTATFTLARDHFHTEQFLRASGMAFTFLRDNLYADFVPFFAVDGVLRGPAGDGRAAFVAIADVAACAGAVLRDPAAHAGRTYELSGPMALTMGEAAAVLADVTGRPARYEPETVAQAYASRAHYGAPDWQLDAWVSTYTAVAAGELAEVTQDVPHLSGHPATPLPQVLREAGAAALG